MVAPDRLPFGHAWISTSAAIRGVPGVAVVPGGGSRGVVRYGALRFGRHSRDYGVIRFSAHGYLVGQFGQFGQPGRDA